MQHPSEQNLIYIAIAAAVFIVAVGWSIFTMNRFAQLRNLLRESFSDLDVQLRRRHDLIPNLVETVKAYAHYESDVLDQVTQARSAAMVATRNPVAQIANESMLVGALNNMFARVEAYPQLKANAQFLSLQSELVNTEDRIAAARRFYNANVRNYNILVASFPSSLIAGMRGLAPIPYLELQALNFDPPKVDLSASYGPGQPPPSY